MSNDEYEPDWSEGPDMEQAKATGDGITVQINSFAMERIEAAAAAGVRQELSRRLDKIITDTINDIVETKLNETVGKIAEDAVTAYLMKPRQKTNAWGEQISGSPVTISEVIPEKVGTWLSEKINSRGERADHYDKNAVTRLEYIINKHVRDELTIATKDAANQVSEQAKKVVSAHVGRFVAEQMIPQIELKGAAA